MEADLEDELLKKVDEAGRADIVLGIPSYNNARTIGHVVRSVQAGLLKYFPHSKSIIVNSDGGSADGTLEVAASAAVEDPRALMISHDVVEPHTAMPSQAPATKSGRPNARAAHGCTTIIGTAQMST